MVASIWNVFVLQYDDFQNLAMIEYGDGKLTCYNSSMETWTSGNQEDNEDVAPCFQLQLTVEEMIPTKILLLLETMSLCESSPLETGHDDFNPTISKKQKGILIIIK